MNQQLNDITVRYLKEELGKLSTREREIIEQFKDRRPVSYDTNLSFDEKMTFGERIADKVAAFGGSWTFIIIFICLMGIWVIINSLMLGNQNAFDPYPYILLNLFLSMLASLQAPIILMSQNRQAAKDRLDAQHDYEVNLKAELEILSLHDKLDELREARWQELILIQQQQIELLTKIVEQKSVR